MEIKKPKAKAKKKKAKDAKTGALGMGDAYAYAVEGLTEDQSESDDSWLGVSKKTLNPNDYVGREKLNVKNKK